MQPTNKWPILTEPAYWGHVAAVPIPDLDGDDSELEPAGPQLPAQPLPEQREDIEQLPAQPLPEQQGDIELTSICRQFSAVELGEEDPDAKRCRGKKRYTEPEWHAWIEARVWAHNREGKWRPYQKRDWEKKYRVEAHKDSKERWNMFLNESGL